MGSRWIEVVDTNKGVVVGMGRQYSAGVDLRLEALSMAVLRRVT